MDTTPGSAQQSLEKYLPIAIKPLSGLGGGGGWFFHNAARA